MRDKFDSVVKWPESLSTDPEVPNSIPALPNMIASVVYWSEFLAIHSEFRVRFPALPDFMRSSGFGTGPLSLVSTTEEELGRKSSGSGLGNR
jgi:hypothetical protein